MCLGPPHKQTRQATLVFALPLLIHISICTLQILQVARKALKAASAGPPPTLQIPRRPRAPTRTSNHIKRAGLYYLAVPPATRPAATATMATATSPAPQSNSIPPTAAAAPVPRNPVPLSAGQEQQVRDLYYKRVRTKCADEIRGRIPSPHSLTIPTAACLHYKHNYPLSYHSVKLGLK